MAKTLHAPIGDETMMVRDQDVMASTGKSTMCPRHRHHE